MASRDFDLGGLEMQGSVGLDSLLSREPELVTPTPRKKVASLRDLESFIRLSTEMLIHKADKDLWTICREPNGSMYVERMFDDNGEPLKG